MMETGSGKGVVEDIRPPIATTLGGRWLPRASPSAASWPLPASCARPRWCAAAEVTPRELVETALARIEALDPQLNAFRVVFAERALLEADAAGGRAGGSEKLPLLGVPIAVKDDTPVAGTARTRGSHAHGGPEPADAEIVRRLRAAGAIVIGITRTPELAAWPFTETLAGGITRNPWDPQRTPGGSSGGSAAAVSAAPRRRARPPPTAPARSASPPHAAACSG